MGRFYGKIGFSHTEEDPYNQGVWLENIVERPYYGDIVKQFRRISSNPSSVNDNVELSMEVSILADPYAVDHMYNMRYVDYMGKWKVTSVSVQMPRLILTLGGIYNVEEN